MKNNILIKAPYNFVPLNKTVVSPWWADYISHDIPFRDGKSGTLDVTITAHSPIFVRNGAAKNAQEKTRDFSKFQGKHFIPGSSIKGMLSNVLEIMSFGKLNKVNDHRYSIRDLSPAAKDIYLNNFKARDIYAGWLRKEGETYLLEDCGAPGRISHREIDEKFNTDFSTYFSDKGRFDQRRDEQKSAQFKYGRFNGHSRNSRFSFSYDSAGRQVYHFDENGKDEGQIIFTGQPGPRKQMKNGRWTGHHLEFIFFGKKGTLQIENPVMENFFFAYYEHDENSQSIDWQHWRKKLKKGKQVPVFFRKDGAGKVKDLGLSFLYKLPYRNSISEAIQFHQEKVPTDLAEAIFGFIANEKEDQRESLKGRVHIGHAFESANIEVDRELREEVLSGPKASYFPNYIRQDIRKGQVQKYRTLMDAHPEPAGWKRYPVHKNGVKTNPPPPPRNKDEKVNYDITSPFIPLKSGAEFKCKIRYHNLRETELGALLSALTFHNTSGTFHSIGMAKPLGYGKVSIGIGSITEKEKLAFLKAYEAFMNAALGFDYPEWHNTEQLRELINMASEQENTGTSELAYMKMGMGRGENHFVEAKKAMQALDRYTNLQNIQSRSCATFILEEDVQKAKAAAAAEKRKYESKGTLQKTIEKFKEQTNADFYQLFETEKANLLAALKQRKGVLEEQEAQRKLELEMAERAKRKEEKKAAVRETSPDFDSVENGHRKAFDMLKKLIQRFAQEWHGIKYEKLKKAMDNGVLPDQFRDALIDKIVAIVNELNKGELNKWKKDFSKNPYLKKIAEWIGKEQAMELLKKIRS
ncbi:MAG: TIGR03986 family CRISPR-associated RAMP protein [Bacteroidota bacterium]